MCPEFFVYFCLQTSTGAKENKCDTFETRESGYVKAGQVHNHKGEEISQLSPLPKAGHLPDFNYLPVERKKSKG